MPKEFKTPDGLTLRFDEADPRLSQFRAFAHEQNWDQSTFSKMLGIEAARVAHEYTQIAAAQAKELGNLGAKGPERVTAAKAWLSSIIGKEGADQIMDRLVLASDVEAVEKLQAHFSTQGGGSFNGNGRDPHPPTPPKSLEQRLYPTTPAQQRAN